MRGLRTRKFHCVFVDPGDRRKFRDVDVVATRRIALGDQKQIRHRELVADAEISRVFPGERARSGLP